jgi:hypothetical protein
MGNGVNITRACNLLSIYGYGPGVLGSFGIHQISKAESSFYDDSMS